MKAEGLNLTSDDDAARYNTLKWQRFMDKCNVIIQAKWPQATIFYNGGASQYHPAWHGGNTHSELNGVMDMPTYENIGHAYAYVEQIEEYDLDGAPCANLGVFLSGSEPDDRGVANMLMENQIDFEVVALGADLNRFAARLSSTRRRRRASTLLPAPAAACWCWVRAGWIAPARVSRWIWARCTSGRALTNSTI